MYGFNLQYALKWTIFFVGTHHNFPRQSCFHNHSNHCIYHSQKYIYQFPYISMYLLGKLKMKKSQILQSETHYLGTYTFFSCQVNRIQQVVRFGSNHGFNSQSSQGRRNRVSTGFTGNQRLTQV